MADRVPVTLTERLRPRLRTFRDEHGNEPLGLPDAPLPDPPPHFLPEYDNVLLSPADRTRIIADEHRERVFTKGAVLLDGSVCGAWKIARKRGIATLLIEPFGALLEQDGDALTEEGERLVRFVGEGAEAFEVRFTEKT